MLFRLHHITVIVKAIVLIERQRQYWWQRGGDCRCDRCWWQVRRVGLQLKTDAWFV